MTTGRGNICGEDVLVDILKNGFCMPRRKVTVNVVRECDLLVHSLVDALQVCFFSVNHMISPRLHLNSCLSVAAGCIEAHHRRTHFLPAQA
jgi:hypothetical protein